MKVGQKDSLEIRELQVNVETQDLPEPKVNQAYLVLLELQANPGIWD